MEIWTTGTQHARGRREEGEGRELEDVGSRRPESLRF